jgi:hypothetical protein
MLDERLLDAGVRLGDVGVLVVDDLDWARLLGEQDRGRAGEGFHVPLVSGEHRHQATRKLAAVYTGPKPP